MAESNAQSAGFGGEERSERPLSHIAPGIVRTTTIKLTDLTTNASWLAPSFL
jgi:hypothetical protein